MFGHLPEDTLMDLVDGTAPPRAREHVASCPTCEARVEGAVLAWAQAQACEVPEPSPFYWEAFRRQVDGRIQGAGRRHWLRVFVPVAAAAGLVAALSGAIPSRQIPAPPSAASVLPAWSALPAAEDDPGLEVLQAVVSTGSDLSSSYERGGVQELLSELSDEENQALADRLKVADAKAGTL